jgi:propanol-preferring alcohol dehydrogenase
VKAFQFVEWQQPGQLRDVPVPEPGAGEVLVKVGGAGACHSDLHLLEAPAGSKSMTLPFTLGHENAGWVETMGSGATGFAPGDPVIVYGPWGCGLCMNCRQGMENTARRRANPVRAASAAPTAAWPSISASRRRAT